MSYILDYLGFESRELPDRVNAQNITEFFREELKKGKEFGYTPVIIPLEDNLEDFLADNLEESGSYKTSELLSAEGFFERLSDENTDLEDIKGNITKGDKNDTLVSVTDYASGELAECAVVHLPTDKPWEAALLVPFGGWNECPEPLEMAAVLKLWYEQYGAVPAAITHDTLELVLPKPVPREKAMEVARQHFLFCPDRIFQCTSTGTIGELAGDLSVSTVWYFWWD
ncbi:MAG: DUF4253 domain-containing protein [Ruminococcus sp.]|nr:DUF4253 domain-containing protein [Ruminococcus sp.]